MKIITDVYVIYNNGGTIAEYSVRVYDEYYAKTTYAVGGNNVTKEEFNSFMKKWCRLSPVRAEGYTSTIEI